MRILVSGPPLAGKTRQGGNLPRMPGVPHVATRGLIRESAATGDTGAMRLLGLVPDGALAPSDAITRLVSLSRTSAKASCSTASPRRLAEAEALLDHLVDVLFVLETTADVLFERLRYRASQGRSDDGPSTLQRRILPFEIETRPVHALLSDADVSYCRVDANGEPDEITRAILETLPAQAAIQAPEPSAAVLDSWTLRFSPKSGERAGYDGAKCKRGPKLHMGVDTPGYLPALHITPADADG